MEKQNQKIRCRLHRLLAVLLACVMTAALAPEGFFSVKVSATTDHGTVEGYEWHRVNVASDLPAKGTRCPVLILWEKDDNTIHYANGGYAGSSNKVDGWDAVSSGSWVKGTSGLPDPFSGKYTDTLSFITTDVLTTWEMYITGEEDDDNHDAPMVRFYPNSNCLLTGYDDFDFPNKETAGSDHWTIYTSEYGGKYGKNVKAGKVKIFANVKYADTGFMYYGSRLYGYCDTTYDYDTFIMYWGEKRDFSAFTDNYTVAEGQVLNVDDGAMLDENKTIIVQPGGVMSIEGTFYNNGTIENHGTVILQENACICCSPNVNSEAGRILCSGSDVSLKPFADAQIAQDQQQIAELKERIGGPYEFGSLKAAERTMQDGCGLLSEQLKEEQDEIDKLDDLKDRLDMLEYQYEEAVAAKEKAEESGEDTKELEADIAKKEKTIKELREEYKEALEPHQSVLDEYYEYKSQLDQIRQEIAAAEATIRWLEEDIVRCGTVPDELISGEGSLITMKGSRLLIGVDKDSSATLMIEDGANVTVNGYLISPTQIRMGNAKLKVCRNGVLMAGFYYSKGISGFPAWQPPALEEFDWTDEGFSSMERDSYDIRIESSEYVLEDEGMMIFSGSGPALVEKTTTGCDLPVQSVKHVDPNYGSGIRIYGFIEPAPSPTA